MLPIIQPIQCLQDPTKNKKYFKRGDLLAKEQEEYLKKYGPQIKEPEENQTDVKNERGLTQCLFGFILLKGS